MQAAKLHTASKASWLGLPGLATRLEPVKFCNCVCHMTLLMRARGTRPGCAALFAHSCLAGNQVTDPLWTAAQPMTHTLAASLALSCLPWAAPMCLESTAKWAGKPGMAALLLQQVLALLHCGFNSEALAVKQQTAPRVGVLWYAWQLCEGVSLRDL